MNSYLRIHIDLKDFKDSFQSFGARNLGPADLVNLHILRNGVRFIYCFEVLLTHCDYFAIPKEVPHLFECFHLLVIVMAVQYQYWKLFSVLTKATLLFLKCKTINEVIYFISEIFLADFSNEY
jgi:hypothetical protein